MFHLEDIFASVQMMEVSIAIALTRGWAANAAQLNSTMCGLHLNFVDLDVYHTWENLPSRCVCKSRVEWALTYAIF